MALGARNKFGVPMFDPKGLSKANVLYWKSTCDIVGTFWCFLRDSESI